MTFLKTGLFLFLVLATALAPGQTSPSPKRKTPLPAKTPSSQGAAQRDPEQAGGSTGSQPDPNTSDPDDHVRCFFTPDQLKNLRPVATVVKLTEADQSNIVTAVVKTLDEANGTDLSLDQKRRFIARFTGDLDNKLVGKTPGEVLATLMSLLYEIQNEAMAQPRGPAAAANATQPLSSFLTNQDLLAQTIIERTKNNAQVQNNFKQNPNWFKGSDPVTTLSNIESILQVPSADPNVVQTQTETADTKSALIGARQLGGAALATARTELNSFAKLGDIGCAFQIMSWDDARLMFGRSVADEFIAVQITVRNLNQKEEFVVHNAMLAVDTDINGAMGQYFEGVDKIAVEAYNNAGESLTRRGITGHAISAASTLLSTLQPILGMTNFSNAVAAFNGGVPAGWAVLSPDHQKEQLTMIANYGFSAAGNFKTMVPKASAATFYTWFPAKPFLEGWWVQDCARGVLLPKNPPSKSKPQLGVDLDAVRTSICNDLKLDQLKTVPYQKWSSVSNQLFRDLSLAAVAGIHVREDSKNNALITDLKCPKDTQGRLDLSKPSSNGTISCDVAGDNLDKVSKLRLENASNAVDPARPEGVVSEVSSDNASAKVTFNVSELKAAAGDAYNVLALGKDGTEASTRQRLYLNKTGSVTLTKVDPTTLDLSKQPLTITLSGTGLDTLKKLGFSTGTGGDCKQAPVVSCTAQQARVDLEGVGLTSGTWAIYLQDCTEANKSKLTLTITETTRIGPPDKTKSTPKASPTKPAADGKGTN
jgi:hypothetical protein